MYKTLIPPYHFKPKPLWPNSPISRAPSEKHMTNTNYLSQIHGDQSITFCTLLALAIHHVVTWSTFGNLAVRESCAAGNVWHTPFQSFQNDEKRYANTLLVPNHNNRVRHKCALDLFSHPQRAEQTIRSSQSHPSCFFFWPAVNQFYTRVPPSLFLYYIWHLKTYYLSLIWCLCCLLIYFTPKKRKCELSILRESPKHIRLILPIWIFCHHRCFVSG